MADIAAWFLLNPITTILIGFILCLLIFLLFAYWFRKTEMQKMKPLKKSSRSRKIKFTIDDLIIKIFDRRK